MQQGCDSLIRLDRTSVVIVSFQSLTILCNKNANGKTLFTLFMIPSWDPVTSIANACAACLGLSLYYHVLCAHPIYCEDLLNTVTTACIV